MATLNANRRSRLKAATFGMPGERKYPMPDKSHAANAKARATQMVKAGKLSEGSAEKIKAKANRILGAGHHDGESRHGGDERKNEMHKEHKTAAHREHMAKKKTGHAAHMREERHEHKAKAHQPKMHERGAVMKAEKMAEHRGHKAHTAMHGGKHEAHKVVHVHHHVHHHGHKA